jgi:hypothetical protein
MYIPFVFASGDLQHLVSKETISISIVDTGVSRVNVKGQAERLQQR